MLYLRLIAILILYMLTPIYLMSAERVENKIPAELQKAELELNALKNWGIDLSKKTNLIENYRKKYDDYFMAILAERILPTFINSEDNYKNNDRIYRVLNPLLDALACRGKEDDLELIKKILASEKLPYPTRKHAAKYIVSLDSDYRHLTKEEQIRFLLNKIHLPKYEGKIPDTLNTMSLLSDAAASMLLEYETATLLPLIQIAIHEEEQKKHPSKIRLDVLYNLYKDINSGWSKMTPDERSNALGYQVIEKYFYNIQKGEIIEKESLESFEKTLQNLAFTIHSHPVKNGKTEFLLMQNNKKSKLLLCFMSLILNEKRINLRKIKTNSDSVQNTTFIINRLMMEIANLENNIKSIEHFMVSQSSSSAINSQ